MSTPSAVGNGRVVAVSLVAALGGFLFGFDSSVINGAVPGIQAQYSLSPTQTGFVVSVALLGCAVAGAAVPLRIVSTAPSITEMLYAVGLGAKVVGVTTYCHYPPDARTKPKIGTYIEPDLERIVSLRPDLVVIQKNPINLAAKLAALKLNVLEVSHDTIDEVRLQSGGGVDCVLDIVGSAESLATGVASLKPGGRLIVVGYTPDEYRLSAKQFAQNEFELSGSRGGSFADLRDVVQTVASGQIRSIVTQRRPLREVNEALAELKSGRVQGRLVLDCQ